MFVDLRDTDASRCGNKAATLGRLLTAGLPVPDGVVLPFGASASDLGHLAAEAWRLLGPGPVAVRSSADGEDAPRTSMAGLHATVLGARTPAQIADAVQVCWDSAFSARAAAYRRRLGAPVPRMAVIIQRLVEADVAGVMFVTEADTLIEAARGLGTAVVEGRLTPDRYRVEADGTVHHQYATGSDCAGTSGTGVLDADAAARLAALGRRAAVLLGGPQDVEWAIAAGTAWLVQSRPVTAPLPRTRQVPPGTAPLTGSPGSGGIASGPARVVRGPADFATVRPGDILVCPFTDPAWTPLLAVAAGVITQTGGVLSHAAIVAREFAIPAVLGVPGAVTRIADGDVVTVDGDAGTVTLEPGA